MAGKTFDQIARMLAMGVPRRQILRFFAAGLGASFVALFRGPRADGVAQAAPVAQGPYLPLIFAAGAPRICGLASTCDSQYACSTDSSPSTCRCLLSAEGEIRCGVPPLCDTQLCTTSADCANLGAGYFCDTVGSGCCSGEDQRCIAPCPTEAPCPEELVCGNACCAPNNTCLNGRCVDPVEGTWTGTLTHEGESAGVRFILAQRMGQISGRMLMLDPVSQEYLENGEITGVYNLDYSTIFLESDSYTFGDFEGDSFTGTFYFAAFEEGERFEVALAMQRA
jgi:hypothetical protein